jgi:small multidrug resistance pump
MKWLHLIIAVVSEVIATSALKSSESFTKLYPSLIVVAGYGTAFYFLSLTLRSMPVGIAYAVWSGVGVLLVTLVGMFVYGQRIDLPGWVGIGLITAGVLVLNILSKSSSH